MSISPPQTIKDLLKQADHLRNRQGDPRQAIDIIEKYEDNFPDDADKVVLYHALASLYRDVGQFSKAADTYLQAANLAKTNSENILLADNLRLQAFLQLQAHQNPDKAEKIANEAADIIDKVDDSRESQTVKANILAIQGNIKFIQQKWPQALDYYKQALSAAHESGFHEREVTIQGDIGNVYIQQKEYDKAIDTLIDALYIARRIYKKAVPNFLIRLGHAYLAKGNFEKAEEFCQEAFDLATSQGWHDEQKNAIDGFIQIYQAQDNTEQTQKYQVMLKKLQEKD